MAASGTMYHRTEADSWLGGGIQLAMTGYRLPMRYTIAQMMLRVGLMTSLVIARQLCGATGFCSGRSRRFGTDTAFVLGGPLICRSKMPRARNVPKQAASR